MGKRIKESIPDKRVIIEMIDGIENRQYLEMIYGFVSAFYEKEVKDSESDSKGL